MTILPDAVREGFLTGMEKSAVWGSADFRRLGNAAGLAGSLGGVGALGGSVIGGLHAGYKDYQNARAQGGSVGASLASGAAGSLGGAMRGATLGGAGGVVAGAAIGAAAPNAAKSLRDYVTSKGYGIGAASRFGQRNMHAVTGWVPEGGVKSIGLGTALTKGSLEGSQSAAAAARDAVGKARESLSTGDMAAQLAAAKTHTRAIKGSLSADKALARATKAHQSAQTVEDMGLTSIPGYMKSIHDKGFTNTARAAVGHSLGAQDAVGKAMMIGIPAASVAAAALSPDGQSGGQVGQNVAHTALGALTSPLPMTTAGLVTQPIADAARYVGSRFTNRGA